MNPRDYIANMPTMEERFGFASANTIIGDLLARIRRTQVENPDKGELAVMMRTPDGSIMDMESLWPEGFATFRAEGYVNGMPCFIVGHVSTLSLFCAFEERKGRARVGFRTDTIPANAPATEPQSEAEQTEP
jgi:hypothetical protein